MFPRISKLEIYLAFSSHHTENVFDTKLTGPGKPLIERKSFANITCDGNGNITSVQWMKDNSPLNPSDRVIFSSDNKSVSIGPVIRSDGGEYQCTLANPVSHESAKLNVIINCEYKSS